MSYAYYQRDINHLLSNPSTLTPIIIDALKEHHHHLVLVNDEVTEKHFITSMDWLHRYTTDKRWDLVERAMRILITNIIDRSKQKRMSGLGEIFVRRIKTDERDGIKVQVNYV